MKFKNPKILLSIIFCESTVNILANKQNLRNRKEITHREKSYDLYSHFFLEPFSTIDFVSLG